MPRLNEDVMWVLLGDIVGGSLAEGVVLPSAERLARQFRVSRPVVEECLRALEKRGLVEVVQGRGAVVQPSRQWDRFDAQVSSALLSSVEWGGAVLEELLECRAIVEVELAELAVERASTAAVESLAVASASVSDAAVRAPSCLDAERRFWAADVSFHVTLAQAAGSRALAWYLLPTIELPVWEHRRECSRARFTREPAEHEQIVDAISARDSGRAREAMRSHLRSLSRDLGVVLVGTDG